MEERRSTVIIADYSQPKFSKSKFINNISVEQNIEKIKERDLRCIFWLNLMVSSLALPVILLLAKPIVIAIFASNAWVS
jgi:hypothetical protein